MKNLFILDNSRIKNLIKLIFLVTATYFLYLFLIEKININTFFYLLFLFFINYSLFYIYFNNKKEGNYIPIYPLILFYYLTTFCLIFYFFQDINIGRYSTKLVQNFSPDELMYRFVKTYSCGLIFFSIGYFFMNFFNYKKEISIFQKINKYNYFLTFLFFIVIIVYYINFPNKYYTIGVLNQLKQPLILFIAAFLQIRYLESNKKLLLYLNLLFVSIFFILEISFGSIVFPFLIVAMLLSINYYKLKKVNLLTVILACVSIFYINSIKLEIRSLTWLDQSQLTKTEIKKNNYIHKNLGTTANVISSTLSREFDKTQNSNVKATLESEIELLEKIIFIINDEPMSILNPQITILLAKLKTIQEEKASKDIFLNHNLASDSIYEDPVVFIDKIKKIQKDSIYNTALQEEISDVLTANVKTKKLTLNSVKNPIMGSQNVRWQTIRFSHSSHTLQVVLDKTPYKIDFVNGISYKAILYQVIPRFLNPNKKQELWGSYWGKRYGILHKNDNFTSWNFPVLTEFYANYGLKGVCIGMFLLGTILKLIIMLVNFNSKNSVEFVFVYVVVFNFFYQESNLTQITGAAINQTLFFGMILFIFLLYENLMQKFYETKGS